MGRSLWTRSHPQITTWRLLRRMYSTPSRSATRDPSKCQTCSTLPYFLVEDVVYQWVDGEIQDRNIGDDVEEQGTDVQAGDDLPCQDQKDVEHQNQDELPAEIHIKLGLRRRVVRRSSHLKCGETLSGVTLSYVVTIQSSHRFGLAASSPNLSESSLAGGL